MRIGPPKVELASRTGFIHPSHGRRVGRLLDQIWIGFHFGNNGLDGGDEAIELMLWFRFGWFHHNGTIDHDREVNRRRMESVIDEPLGQVLSDHTVGELLVGVDRFDELAVLM